MWSKVFARLSVAALTVFAIALWHVPATAQGFTEAQREELGEIIRDYLITNPEVLEEAIQALRAREDERLIARSRSAIRENADDLFRASDDQVIGNLSGDVTVVEFFDYNCGFCRAVMDTVVELLDSDGNIRFVMKEWPIQNAGSMYAAMLSIASRNQDAYWEYHNALMSHDGHIDEAVALDIARDIGLDVDRLRTDMEAPEVRAEIEENYRLAEAVGVNGTPSFIIGDTLIPGAVSLERLQQAVEEARRDESCEVC